jgi:hypothetical protein
MIAMSTMISEGRKASVGLKNRPRFSFYHKLPSPVLLFIASGLLLMLFGCAGRAPKLDREISPRELYLRVAENYRRLQTFQGNGRLAIESPQIQFSAPAHILVMKPDSLFIKVEAALGVDAGFFFVDRRTFASYSPLENIYYHGETEKVRELTLFRMDLTYDEMMSGIVGTALPPFDSSFTVTRESGDYRFAGWRKQKSRGAALLGSNGNGGAAFASESNSAGGDHEVKWQLIYWVDAGRGVVTKAEQRDDNGEIYARQEFKRFHKVSGVWLPQLIQMERPAEQERLTIFYNHVEANAKLSPAEFVIRVPPNAKRIKLSDPRNLPEARQPLKE